MSSQDYYEILGVSKNATQEEIRKAFLKIAKQYHPDKTKGDKAKEEIFKKANNAYNVLSNESKRREYDARGSFQFDDFDFSSFNGSSSSIFDEVFNSFFESSSSNKRRRRRSTPGNDLNISFDVSLEDLHIGIKKEVSFDTYISCESCSGKGLDKNVEKKICPHCRGKGSHIQSNGFFNIQQTCSYCRGEGYLNISYCKFCNGEGRVYRSRNVKIDAFPKNNIVVIRDKGECGRNGGGNGNLIVKLNIKKHKIFKKQEFDIICNLKIPVNKAILGGNVEVMDIEEKKIIIQIPKGSQNNSYIKLRGYGLRKSSFSRGDLIIYLNVIIPEYISNKQNELMKEFAKEEDENFTNKNKNFLSRFISFFNY